ncbi:MAG: chemotaxis response regulator protein-glutamate methylesterase [Pirellulales bacterium]|nr:chemotaxis response regulator protein-glutamate methylesterase [Pirellulales bacterium]
MIVDDSRLMRTMISDAVAKVTDFEVVGFAASGREAIAQVERLRPDVVTMDVMMPGMSGLEALAAIMQNSPCRVIIVSSLTTRMADTTLEALDLGAVDYVAKPDGASQFQQVVEGQLIPKLRMAAAVDLQALRRQGTAPVRRAGVTSRTMVADRDAAHCIAIGISTGGPPALTQLFEQLAPPLPPIVIVQHMPAQFTGPFAARLNGISALTVREAEDGATLRPNEAWIAPGGKHLSLRRVGTNVVAVIRDGDPVSGHKPSVDVMMISAAHVFGRRCLGVIMTGMGSDGADGCSAIKAAGGDVIGQDEASSAVYGMNKVAFNRGHVEEQFSLADAAEIIAARARRAPVPV